MDADRMGLPISEFKQGQVLVRLQKAEFRTEEYNENLGITQVTTKFKDGSYRGEPLKFLGIENNMIYLEKLSGYDKGSMISLAPDNGWDAGWGMWVDPKILAQNSL
jgi:hypothetical protein